jgi:hypothetical protein
MSANRGHFVLSYPGKFRVTHATLLTSCVNLRDHRRHSACRVTVCEDSNGVIRLGEHLGELVAVSATRNIRRA